MRAIIYDRFGDIDVLHLGDVAEPILADDAVLIEMKATSVNTIDTRTRKGLMGPLVNKTFPKVPGADVAGVVVRVGAKVSGFQAGDRVFGARDAMKGGAFADLVSVPAASLAKIPEGLSFDQAAGLPIAGLAALQSLHKLGKVKSGDKVLIFGASGAAGLFAIQIAKTLGAHVTAVAGAKNLDALKAMGADHVVDYRVAPLRFDDRFDVILEYSGALDFSAGRLWLTPKGRLIDSGPSIPKVIGSAIANLLRGQKNLMLMTAATTQGLNELGAMVRDGRLKTTIAAQYPLSQAVEAFRHHERGGTLGKVVVTR